MVEKFNFNKEALQKREVRQNDLDTFYSLEGGVTLREKLESLTQEVDPDSNETKLLASALDGPVMYLEMPDRYDLSDLLGEVDNEEFRMLREQLRKQQPEMHALLENQRVRMNSINATLLHTIMIAQLYNVGDQDTVTELMERYEHLVARVEAKEERDARDHRIMSDEEKDEVVKEASELARDTILFVIQTVASK